jgi:hypothetical protein
MQRREEQFEMLEFPQGFGVRQSSAAFEPRLAFESARGLAQSKTLRVCRNAAHKFASPRFLRLCLGVKKEITNG